ncbi:MAG TPA: hypothetical protein ENG45_00505, partial [Candidatus Aenigmarchaeota archaeon]|nr:hypothetical protein [Candidatus Aenigmarchaeota archaeon]
MKKFLMILLFFLLFIRVSYAEIKYLNVTASIEENNVNFYVVWRFTDDIKKVILPIKGEISDVLVEKGKCSVESNEENLLICGPSSPFMIGDIIVRVKFKVSDMIEKKGNISLFSMDIPILTRTNNIVVKVKLPTGMFVSEEVLLPVSPSGSASSIEERRVVQTWVLKNKERGDIIPIRLYYEPVSLVSPIEQVLTLLTSIKLLILLMILLILFFFFFLYRKAKEHREAILSILNEDEKLIVNLVRSKGGRIIQRRLVDLSGFSKAKVSRIVQDLC